MSEFSSVRAALLGCVLALLAQGAPAETKSDSGTGLVRLWNAGQPGFGLYVSQPATASDEEHPVYTVETGRALAENTLLDFAFLSLEQHYDFASARNVAQGLRSGGPNAEQTLLVRIPPIHVDGAEAARARVQELVELGANGVVIPHVMSLEEAREAVSFFEGMDVWSPENRDGTLIAMLIVEDPDVFQNLDAIAAIPGYSALVCGIGSLTAALDGDRGAAETINLRVLATSTKAGMADLITVNEDSVEQRIEQGFLGLLAYGPTAEETLRLGRAAVGR
jgi:2-keto-3-deoxy-L-rhamnonate aldolase RhmA